MSPGPADPRPATNAPGTIATPPDDVRRMVPVYVAVIVVEVVVLLALWLFQTHFS